MKEKETLSTGEVAAKAGISKQTLRRLLKERKIREPKRDRNRWRVWTVGEANQVVEYVNQTFDPDDD
jgi:excisionase family DNA binding protein